MKINFFLFIFFLTIQTVSGQITFEKAYGGSFWEYGYSVQQTTDSGYILLGSTESFSSSKDFYLIKTDQYGDTVWTKTYGGPNIDKGSEVQQTIDGGYILCGTNNNKVSIIKTNNTGDTLWTKEYDGTGYSVVQTTDSGYAVGGDIWLGGANYDMLLIKTNYYGDTLWSKTYGDNQTQGCKKINKTIDGGFILIGYTTTNGASDIYLVKTDSNGIALWTKSFGGGSFETGYSVEQTSDSGYILLGNSNSFGGDKFYMIKTDINGDSLWTKTYDNGNNNDEGYAVKQTIDGGYAFVAETDKNGLGYEEVYLVRTNTLGDTLWTRTFREGNGNGLQITTDGGYIIIGFTSSFGSGMSDVYLIKTDTNGIMTGILNTQKGNTRLINSYPNPFNDFTTVEFNNIQNINITLALYNALGRPVRIISNITTGKAEIRKNDLTSGLYFFQVSSDKHVLASGKLIIE